MKPELAKYKNKKIRVAVSGGRDSMALLHFLLRHASEYGIELSALNCDHKLRGERSAEDSAFVENWCALHGVPLIMYSADCKALSSKLKVGTEEAARIFRRDCYRLALRGLDMNGNKILDAADCIATAHHMNDNAETVLFNLARGASLAGVKGIYDTTVTVGGESVQLIRPLICCDRAEINDYIAQNGVPFVEDETNSSDAYTRNYIRINVLPQLEKAVPEAAKSIYRFSRLAAEDEEYFLGEIERLNLICFEGGTAHIKNTDSRALFSRAAVIAIKDFFNKKDYTSEHVEKLFFLQFCGSGKKFEFLSLVAFKEQNGIAICAKTAHITGSIPFSDFKEGNFGQAYLKFAPCGINTKIPPENLMFDLQKIPAGAVIRTRRQGDKFHKFGGGTKSLGDFLTDKKIPVRLRDKLPLIADGDEILVVAGVEISEKVKVTRNTSAACLVYCKIN